MSERKIESKNRIYLINKFSNYAYIIFANVNLMKQPLSLKVRVSGLI